MSPAALRTFDPADSQGKDRIRKEDRTAIVGMERKAGRMPAGAFQPVHLEGMNDRIVIILRKLIVITDRNGYHSLVRRSPQRL